VANSGLARMAKRALNRLDASKIRGEVESYEGQIFVWNRQGFKDSVRQTASEDITEKLVKEYDTLLASAERNIIQVKKHRKRLLEAKARVMKLKIQGFNPKTHKVYAVKNYAKANDIKRKIGEKYKALTGRDSKEITGRMDSGDTIANASGTHIGHGDFGHAVSTTAASGAEAVLKTDTSVKKYSNTQSYKNLEASIKTYKETMDISLDIDHYQEVTARGKLKKTYTPILSSQSAVINMEDAREEKRALKALQEAFNKEYATIVKEHGSRSLEEAVGDVTTYTLLEGHSKAKYKGKAQPKKAVKSKGKGGAKKKTRTTNKMGIIAGTGAPKPKQRKASMPGNPNSIIHFLGVIKSQLPQTVAKNMGDPRLNYRSGRFASSVNITDVIQTPQGFPSVGYTYMKGPYQTFEPGYAQGSEDRDPRKLIDASIRELAAQYAIGRFYTRRV
jgi:hypothetical protein